MRLDNSNSHKHKCPNCGFVWRHANVIRDASKKIFDAGHTCKCGTVVKSIYSGFKRAKHIGCRQPGTPADQEPNRECYPRLAEEEWAFMTPEEKKAAIGGDDPLMVFFAALWSDDYEDPE